MSSSPTEHARRGRRCPRWASRSPRARSSSGASAPGDWVERDEPIVEISTDKVETEVPSPASRAGEARSSSRSGATVDVGTLLARIDVGAKPGEAHAGRGGRSTGDRSTGPRLRPPISPVVRRIADEHDIDLSQVDGHRPPRARDQEGRARVHRAVAAKPRARAGAAHGVAVRGRARATGQPSPPTAATRRRRSRPCASRSASTWCARSRPPRTAPRSSRPTCRAIEAARGQAVVPAVRGPGDDRRAARAPAAERDARGRPADACTRRSTSASRSSLGDDGLIVPVVRDAHELSHEGLAARIKDLAERARTQAPGARRDEGRHVHDHEPGPLRRAAGHADHQPAAGGDPRPRGRGQAAGRGGDGGR